MITKRDYSFDSRFAARTPSIAMADWPPRERPCKDCPALFVATSPSQRRCAKCQAAAGKRSSVRATAKAKARRAVARKEKQN